jgi:hypothetical protein
MTALQWIIKEAKIIRKKSPKMEWKKAVAQASAIYASKHKGKSPVGKKKAAPKKKAAKKRKVSGVKASKEVKKVLAKKGLKMPHGYTTTKRVRKVSGVKKKKISEQSILNRIHKVKHDVERLDEAQHKHMIGTVKPKPSIISLAKKIERLTDFNDHNHSVLTLARFLKEKRAIELMNYIIKMHNNYGHMPQQLIQLRSNILHQLLLKFKHKYGEVDYKLINNAF